MSTAELVERIAAAPALDHVVAYLNIHRDDSYSDVVTSYLDKALQARTDGAPTYSYERWFRIRFTPPFGSVRGFRFWVPDLVVPTGWTLRYGTATAFQSPTNAASVVAVEDLPASDPGPDAPNAGGSVALDGTQARFTDWLVLQASANGEAVVGPMLGWDGTIAIPIPYAFRWTEN